MLTTKRTVKAPAATKNTIRTVTGKLSPVWGTSLSEEFEGLSVVLDSVPFGEDGFSEGGVGSDGLVGSVSVPVAGINVTSSQRRSSCSGLTCSHLRLQSVPCQW